MNERLQMLTNVEKLPALLIDPLCLDLGAIEVRGEWGRLHPLLFFRSFLSAVLTGHAEKA